MGSQSDICLTVSVFGVRLVFPLWICLWTLHLSVSYCLIWAKKIWKKERNKKENNNKPLADFKSVQQVLLVFLDATGRGGWATLFSLTLVLREWGPGLSRTIQFPGLWPRSSVSCQAQIIHSAAHSVSQSPTRSPRQAGHTFPLYYCLCACSARAAGHTVPLLHSLWVHAMRDRWGARFSLATVSGCAVQD